MKTVMIIDSNQKELCIKKRPFRHTLLVYKRTDYTKGIYTSEKPVISNGNDKIHLKWDFNDVIIVHGTRQPVLYSFALDRPRGLKWNFTNYLKNLLRRRLGFM